MQILLSCAKDMAAQAIKYKKLSATQALFQQYAGQLASYMMKYSSEELAKILKINGKIAHQNWLRYQNFIIPEDFSSAAWAFTGMAYKHLKANEWTKKEVDFAQKHLWITSFLYGILRPLDDIKHHRLEGAVRLPELDDRRVFDFWKPLLTESFIESIKNDDGILLNLASEEMKDLFDWKRVLQEVKVIEPQFMVRKGNQYKTVVVYAKMCRGAMAHHVISNAIRQPQQLLHFEYEGFAHQPALGDDSTPVFTIE